MSAGTKHRDGGVFWSRLARNGSIRRAQVEAPCPTGPPAGRRESRVAVVLELPQVTWHNIAPARPHIECIHSPAVHCLSASASAVSLREANSRTLNSLKKSSPRASSGLLGQTPRIARLVERRALFNLPKEKPLRKRTVRSLGRSGARSGRMRT